MLRKFSTPDIALDTFLENRLNESSQLINQGSMVLFERPESVALKKAVAEFYSGGQMPCMQFAQLMRRKKAEMFTLKKLAEKDQGGR